MVSQIINFAKTERKEVANLAKLLKIVLPESGFKLVEHPVFVRCKMAKKDWYEVDFANSDGEKLSYEFQLEERGIYTASLDMSQLPFPTYSNLKDLIESSMPELSKQTVS